MRQLFPRIHNVLPNNPKNQRPGINIPLSLHKMYRAENAKNKNLLEASRMILLKITAHAGKT